MLLSIHQPVYLPGIILFNKIALSDAFMFLGHVPFSKQSWQQRNRINVQGRELFLSVPVVTADRLGQGIDEVLIAPKDPWARKHVGSIRQAYAKRPYFNDYFPALADEITRPHTHLADLNRALIRLIMGWLGIATPVLESRDHEPEGHKTDMLITLCQAAGADHYVSNEGARAYIREDDMAAAGIRHCWQEFEHPVYDQGGAEFVPNLSVIDLLFNTGPAAGEIVRRSGRVVPGAFAP